MDKMKKYMFYIISIVLFALLSNFLIAVALNSNYKDIDYDLDETPEVEIYQAEATKVNGRIRGLIHLEGEKTIDAFYLKIEFYTERDVHIGSKYIEIYRYDEDIPFEVFFRLNNVAYVKTSYVKEKDPSGQIEFIPKDLSKTEIFFGTMLALILLK